jgi:hypothetical protein
MKRNTVLVVMFIMMMMVIMIMIMSMILAVVVIVIMTGMIFLPIFIIDSTLNPEKRSKY